jgi:hypothetical protein
MGTNCYGTAVYSQKYGIFIGKEPELYAASVKGGKILTFIGAGIF